MEPVSEITTLVKRVHWLIKLRWIAAVCVAGGTFFSSNVLTISLNEGSLYSIAGLLAVYNAAMLGMLKHYSKKSDDSFIVAVKRLINIQIFIDLLILTILLHFAGGIENPFVFYYAFHIIMASILLSEKESYFYATSAITFFGLLLFLEYRGILPHHCLSGFIEHCNFQNGYYVLGTYFVFTTTLYLMVYMANYVSTLLKRTEQSLLKANKALCQKDRIKDEYVLRVTHDIKGHLAAIQNCLDVVINRLVGTLNEQQADFINRANDRTRKLTHFIKTLLKLTQIRLSSEFEMEIFPLKSTISTALETVKTKAQDKSIMLNSNIELPDDAVYGNQIFIEEVITNLLLNAIKYTAVDGKIDITAQNEGEHVLMEIIDTGIGIPEKELPKVFDEFYRATNAKKIEKDGTGLGLSIAKQIIERHNGKIWAESKEGIGTKFSFTLPRTANSAIALK